MSKILPDGEKVAVPSENESGQVDIAQGTEDHEIFRSDGAVNFRTVGWLRASVIFVKIIFATGVLSIPSSMYELGALPGAINVIGWCALNTYSGIVLGNFRTRHAGCHSVADMAYKVGGPVLREVCGLCFIFAWVICAASGVIGASSALNALSTHALCTNYFNIIAAVIIAIAASIRKFEHIGWLTWAGFITIFVAVLTVVIGVSLEDRPAAAPQTGDFDLGYHVIGNPTFVAGITAACTIFTAGGGTSAFIPVISEMRRPQDYNKAVYLCMSVVTAAYLSFSLIVYYYCGKWVASPSLGSAGPTIKKAAYGVGLLGLLVSGILYVHVAAKYVFVRILRNSKHLQSNSVTHWGIWLACTIGLSAVAFILASAIPVFNYILALAGSLGLAPLAITLPGWLWLYDHGAYRKGSILQQIYYWLHWGMCLLGVFMIVGGTYGAIVQIQDAYAQGTIGSAFSCADNSGTVST